MIAAQSWFVDPLGGRTDDEWDSLAGQHFYSSAFWLRLCAVESDTGGAVAVDVAGGGRAGVPVVRVGADPHPNVVWNDLLVDAGLDPIAGHGIAVGQVRGYLTHLLTTPGTDRVAAAAAVLDAVRRASSPDLDDGCRVALYLTTPDVELFRAAGVRALPVALPPDADILVPAGRDAWLESMSNHRARSIRREVRKFEAAGYEVTEHPLDEVYRDVGRLAAHVERRYGSEVDVDALIEGFRVHAAFAGERARVLLCRLDGAAVACSFFYHDHETVYMRLAGFDYEAMAGAGEYTTMGFWLPIGLPSVRRSHLGSGSAEAKALRGARLSASWLLDLSEDTSLVGAEDRIREHNRQLCDELRSGPPAVSAALDLTEWEAFT